MTTDTPLTQAQACQKCGLEASSLLHRFCQNAECPVLAALPKPRALVDTLSKQGLEDIIERESK